MEVLLILIGLGVAGYYFFKNNTNRGVETMRAHAFLRQLEGGATLEDASGVADNFKAIWNYRSPSEQNIDVQFVKLTCEQKYGGKQFPMIAEAYYKGMKSNLPEWQQRSVLSTLQRPPKIREMKPCLLPSRHHPKALTTMRM